VATFNRSSAVNADFAVVCGVGGAWTLLVGRSVLAQYTGRVDESWKILDVRTCPIYKSGFEGYST
jgi:hypothetical protein